MICIVRILVLKMKQYEGKKMITIDIDKLILSLLISGAITIYSKCRVNRVIMNRHCEGLPIDKSINPFPAVLARTAL